jgi:pimeloyl-ACP methyl ester carboxylesterase
VEATCPDLVLLGWHLSGLKEVDLLPALRKICPQLHVIALSGWPEERQAALDAGADAFVCKCDPPERLLAAIADCLAKVEYQVSSRRRSLMKRKLLLSVLVFTLLLTSCARPTASPTPTEVVPEATATVEPTREPTPTTKPTPKPIPTSEGYNLSAYNTVQNAADVNAIRIALGYDQINLWGGSYGSLLAQATMRDHPQGIRSVAIVSILPLEKSLFVEGSTTTSNAVMRLLDACAADQACNSAYPNLQEVLFEVIDQLNAEPVPVIVTNPLDGQSYDSILTGDEVLSNLVTFLYFTQIIPVLPQAIYDVYNGNYELMTQLSSTKLALLGLLSRGMMLSVMCTDDLIGRTPEDLLNIMAALPRQLVGSTDPELAIEYGMFGICENWPVEEADPWVKEPLVSDIPTLVLSGEFDPVTPPEYGQLVASYLSNSHFFELPGIGHDILGASGCARSIIGNFIADPTQAPDASCIAEMKGVAFDLPREAPAVVLEPVTYEESGFSGLLPTGWTDELLPRNYRRGLTALDPTTLVQDAVPMTADELFGLLAKQLGFDPELESVVSTESDSLVWDLYSFEYQSYWADLALAEGGGKSYFVLFITPPDERDALYETVFLPVVEALAPLE